MSGLTSLFMSTHARTRRKVLRGVLRVVSWSRRAHRQGFWSDGVQRLCWEAFHRSHSPHFKHYAAARRFNGARRRRVRWEDGELNSVKIPHVRTQAAHPPANTPWSVLWKCLTGLERIYFSSVAAVAPRWISEATKQDYSNNNNNNNLNNKRKSGYWLNMYPWPRI